MARPLLFMWRMIKSIYLHFDTLPKDVQLENSRFYTVSNVAETLAWMVHLVWFFCFYTLKIYPLAWFQFFSIACYISAIIFNRKGYHMTSMSFALGELVVHQVVAVYFLGVGAGFQYFIPVVAIFPFLMPRGNIIWKATLFLLCLTGFLYIELWMVGKTSLYKLNISSQSLFNISNMVLAFGFIGLWAYYLNVAIARAETILRKRTKELAVAEQKAEQEKMQHELAMKERDNEIFRLRNIELKESYEEILRKNEQIEEEKNKSRNLLLNILPEETAVELLDKGQASTKRYESATVLFADFVGFTTKAEQMNAEELVEQIDVYFKAFDAIMIRHGVEKIKTIGDAYMAVGGLPVPNETHARDVVEAAIEMMAFVEQHKHLHKHPFDLRVGIHSGPLVAGVVGNHKFQYDTWGDTVNVAARMEQNSSAGKINISEKTYDLVKELFNCSPRGKIEAKNKGKIDMYFLEARTGSGKANSFV